MLSCKVVETRPFLEEYRSLVVDAFAAKGLMSAAGSVPMVLEARLMVTFHMVASLTGLATDVINNKVTGRKSKWKYCYPNFDASGFHVKHENSPWTDEFSLETLCITEAGLKDVWREGNLLRTCYRDIARIPLPGAAASAVPDEHPDDIYTKAAKIIPDKDRKLPLIIPSTPNTS